MVTSTLPKEITESKPLSLATSLRSLHLFKERSEKSEELSEEDAIKEMAKLILNGLSGEQWPPTTKHAVAHVLALVIIRHGYVERFLLLIVMQLLGAKDLMQEQKVA